MSRRLAAQCQAILTLLQERGNQGARNSELARIALKYTSRISDLRDQGYDVRCLCENATKGIYRYVYFGIIPRRKSRLFKDEP